MTHRDLSLRAPMDDDYATGTEPGDIMDDEPRELSRLGYAPGELRTITPVPSTGTWVRPAPRRNDNPPVERSETYYKRLGGLDSTVLALGATHIAERLGVAAQTVRDWRRVGKFPRMWLRAVRALVCGEIGVIDKQWAGWIVSTGRLRAPDAGDYTFTPGEVRMIRFTRDAMRRLEWENDELRARIRAMQRELDGHRSFPRQADWIAGSFEPIPEPEPSAVEQLDAARAELAEYEERERLRNATDPPDARKYRYRHLWGRI